MRTVTIPVFSFTTPAGFRAAKHARNTGFTLAELLAVVAISAILAAMLLPGLSRAKARVMSASCLNNVKQLQFGWHLYTVDHNDALPSNKWRVVNWEDDCPDGVQTSADAWVLGDATVATETWGIQNGSLFNYVRATENYHCPADRSTVDSLPRILRTRSYSMSYYMNGSERKPERRTKLCQIRAP